MKDHGTSSAHASLAVIAVAFLQNDTNITAIVKCYNLAGQYSADWGEREIPAAAVITVLPVIVVFVLLQKGAPASFAGETLASHQTRSSLCGVR
jgi:ABC-type maltose transport system permease subunit